MLTKNKKVILVFVILLGIIGISISFSLFKKQLIPSEKKTPQEEEPTPMGTTYLNNITGKELEQDIQKIIVEYMDTYYKIMQELEEQDMTYLFADSNGEEAFINQTAMDLLVETRKLKPVDLTLTSAKYDLNVTEIIPENNTIKVTVRESNYLHFRFMEEIESRVYDIENEFTLMKVEDEYKIKQYNKVQDFFVMIKEKYTTKDSLNKIKEEYLDIIRKKENQNAQNYRDFLNGEGIQPKTCNYLYDREKALEYAKKWVNKRNSDWSTFDANCQNYASQVLYNGGIPMDYIGDAPSHLQWKFYNPTYNESQIASGYLYTWTYVPYFYVYAKNNTGLGLCADVDVNMYYAEAGDIIHIGTNLTETGPNRHALVSIGPYKKEDKVVDILVNSNTVDLENYPLSAYTYPYSSLIKIYGYND